MENYFDRISLTALKTSCEFGIHFSNKTGEYGAGVSAVVSLLMGASK